VGDSDNDGVCNAQDNCPNVAGQIGSSCNDGDPCTTNDVLELELPMCGHDLRPTAMVTASAMPRTPVPTLSGQIGSSCNDGNANTINDIILSNCTCAGTLVTFDCEGVANGSALPGTSCDDGNASTGNDTWNTNCQCVGQVIDCMGVAGGTALPGTACNDNNANTINDVWSANWRMDLLYPEPFATTTMRTPATICGMRTASALVK
jgi:hypothetical protein